MSVTTPEGKLKAICRAWLREIGAYIFSPVAFGTTTTLDDLVCLRGHFVGIEYKRPDTRPKPTPRQDFIAAQIERAGGKVFICYDFDELQDWIKTHVL